MILPINHLPLDWALRCIYNSMAQAYLLFTDFDAHSRHGHCRHLSQEVPGVPVSPHNLANLLTVLTNTSFPWLTRQCLMLGGESQLVLSHVLQF